MGKMLMVHIRWSAVKMEKIVTNDKPMPSPRRNHPQHKGNGANPGVGNEWGLAPTQVLPAGTILDQQPVGNAAIWAAAVVAEAAIHWPTPFPIIAIFTQSML